MSSREELQQELVDEAKHRAAAALEDATRAMVNIGKAGLRTCLTCTHWQNKPEACLHPAAGGVRPPARVIAFGCGHHEFAAPF